VACAGTGEPFVATDEITTATIACCASCGPDCMAIEARIRRGDDTVRWDWGRRGARWESVRRTTLFDAAAYDAEVARMGADHGWETPVRRAGRLILTGLALPPGIEGLRVCAGRRGVLEVWLVEEPDEFQIFVDVPWDEERPDESTAEARATLAGPAARWPARWHSIKGGRNDPPTYAGPSCNTCRFDPAAERASRRLSVRCPTQGVAERSRDVMEVAEARRPSSVGTTADRTPR
jgi:hypothetical protein